MNAMNDTMLTIARGGMEITWRYAWALYLIQLATSRHVPLPAAVCAFLMAALVTQLPLGRNWRVYQILLLQVAGFIPFGLWVVHQIQYQSLPFFSLEWIGHLLLDAKSIFLWSILILILLCVWLIWRGGRILVKSSRCYVAVCLQFDKGLGLFFLLLITKAFVGSKTGFHLPGREIVFLAMAYLVFSLAAISMARNQGKVQKSFLAGHQGIGLMLTVSTLVILLGTGTILLVYPYLYNVADSLLIVTKAAARSIDPVMFKTLLFLFRRKERFIQSDEPHTDALKLTGVDTPKVTDVDAQTVAAGDSLFQVIVGWGLFGISGMVFLVGLACFLIYILRALLKKSRDHTTQPLSTGWIWDLLCRCVALPLIVWRGWRTVLGGVDCAAAVYGKMICWGKHSGINLIPSETATEYGNRLMNCFPGLGAEIELIVEAFNREVYGQTTTDQEILFCLRSALQRMKRFRYWPSRIKVWYFK